jgi:hypothetical protein
MLLNIAASAQALITLGSPLTNSLLLHQHLSSSSPWLHQLLPSSKTLTANMSKRKFGIDGDDHMSMFLSLITGD